MGKWSKSLVPKILALSLSEKKTDFLQGNVIKNNNKRKKKIIENIIENKEQTMNQPVKMNECIEGKTIPPRSREVSDVHIAVAKTYKRK